MLKQIGVRLDENLIKQVKMLAIQQETSIQDIFTEALTSYFDNKLTNKNVNKITKSQVSKITNTKPTTPAPKKETPIKPLKPFNPKDYPQYYVLRATADIGNPIPIDREYSDGRVIWTIKEGECPHFDADDNYIPVRRTDINGNVIDVSDRDIAGLEEAHKKPLKREEELVSSEQLNHRPIPGDPDWDENDQMGYTPTKRLFDFD
jgi:hypothetical protein